MNFEIFLVWYVFKNYIGLDSLTGYVARGPNNKHGSSAPHMHEGKRAGKVCNARPKGRIACAYTMLVRKRVYPGEGSLLAAVLALRAAKTQRLV